LTLPRRIMSRYATHDGAGSTDEYQSAICEPVMNIVSGLARSISKIRANQLMR
jgi:hypothetical protein